MGKLKTHSPTYCIMDNWENMLNLTHSTNYIWQAFYKFNVMIEYISNIAMHVFMHKNASGIMIYVN